MLGVLGQATLNFVAVATLLFCCFCVCPKFCDLAKQRRKMFLGVSEVRKIDFALYFFWLCVFFSVFYFLLLRSRDDSKIVNAHTNLELGNPFVVRQIAEHWDTIRGDVIEHLLKVLQG